MRPDLVEVLRCPVCGGGLVLVGRAARCERQHTYDLAKQGYLNLLPSSSKGIEGDSAEMVAARADFLAAGHYRAIRDALVEHAAGAAPAGDSPGTIVEVGAGTAYYLTGLVTAYQDAPGNSPDAASDQLRPPGNYPDTPSNRPGELSNRRGGAHAGRGGRRGIALDVSRYAARRAAKVDPRIGSVVCDAWRDIPLLDNAADLVLNVFAPRNAAEMARILTPGGALLVVTPNQTHLSELVTTLDLLKVDSAKDQRLHDSLTGEFTHHSSTRIDRTLHLDHPAVEQLITMTPSARHLDRTTIQTRVAALPEPLAVQLSVTLSTWYRS